VQFTPYSEKEEEEEEGSEAKIFRLSEDKPELVAELESIN